MLAHKLTTPTTDAFAGLLDRFCTADGKEYMYVQASGAIAQYDVVAIDEDGQAAKITKALADDSHKVGAAQVAFADNEYGYVQIKGPTTINVLASAAADAVLYTSATAGSLDDDGTSQTKIAGLVATAAVGGSAGSVAALAAIEPFADR